MAWNEEWLNADRPKASEITDYVFFRESSARKIFGFYAVWFVVVAISLQFVGTSGVIFLDIPVLIWITLLANISSIGILYFWVYIPERRKAKEKGY